MLDSAGFLTQHMGAHVAAMNMAAPLCAAGLLRIDRALFERRVTHIALATASQIGLVWGWHSPLVFETAAVSAPMMFVMHVSLFLAACWFWLAVITEAARAGWSPLAALLVTGKLFCLLGVLLTFAPRVIYGQVALLPLCFGTVSPWPILHDQQLAGVLMLAACPVVYVTAAVVIARRRLAALDRDGGWSLGRRVA
jgi:putative membrane protein